MTLDWWREPVRAGWVAAAIGVMVALLPGAAIAELRIQQGLVRVLSAEREAIRMVEARPLESGATEAARLATERRYDPDWLLARPAPTRQGAQFRCLKEAIYHEARGEPIYGQFAVAEVILNRVESPLYPDTICGVVNQNAHMRNACQFSFACNGRSRAMTEARARALAGRIADLMLAGAERELTDGATHFHATWVSPSWASRLVRTAQIGVHVFYRRPVRVTSN